VPKVWCCVDQHRARVKEGKSCHGLRPFAGGASLQRGGEHLVERSEVSEEMQSELICGMAKKGRGMDGGALGVEGRCTGYAPCEWFHSPLSHPHASHHAPVDACPHTKFCGWIAQKHKMRADLSLLRAWCSLGAIGMRSCVKRCRTRPGSGSYLE
jgi:hypothetical protein